MTFAPVFQRPYSATFDRRAAAAAVPYYYINYNGTSTRIAGGSGASIDNLPQSAMTVEAWVLRSNTGRYDMFAAKVGSGGVSPGWQVYVNTGNTLVFQVFGTGGTVANVAYPADTNWHHLAFQYTDAAKVMTLYVDGTRAQGGIGTTTSADDAATSLYVGSRTGLDLFWKGAIGWFRISNSARYGTSFTPPSRTIPPVADANTALLYMLTEGSGTSIADSSGNANTGTLSNGTWSAV